MSRRDALYYIMTGEIRSTARRPPPCGLVNEAVPLAQLRERTRELATTLLEKNPADAERGQGRLPQVGTCRGTWRDDYLYAKNEQVLFLIDPEHGRKQGLKQFLDDKSYRPGLKAMKRGG